MLLTEIRRNQKLAAKRNPMYDRNRFAKFLIYLFTAFWAAYLILMGVTLPIAFEEGFPTMEPYDMLNACLPGFLFIDFLLRFLFPTPVQQIKPYLLLPIKKQQLINVLLVQVGLKAFNLFWLFFFVPFAAMTVVRFYGVTGVVCLCTRNLASDGGQRLLERTGAHIATPPHSLGTASRGMLCPAGSRRIFLFIR